MTLLCYVHFMISTLNNEVSGHYFLDKKTFRLIHNIRDPVQYIKVSQIRHQCIPRNKPSSPLASFQAYTFLRYSLMYIHDEWMSDVI